MTTIDTPLDACPHCGSPRISPLCAYFTCKADTTQRDEDKRTHLCREREARQKAEILVAKMHEAALGEIRGPILGVVADIKALRERAEKAEAEVERLREIIESL